MKRIYKYTGLALLLTGLAGQTLAQSQPQVINVPLSRPGEPVSLDISMISAHIEVFGEDRSDASFEVTVEEGTRKIVTPSGTQSLKAGAYSMEVEEQDNHLSVDMDWRANKVKIVARIPHQANLDLSTVNDGVIIVRDITGNLNLDNVNGPITASNITGTVIAESVNDNINVSFASVAAGDVHAFTSVNGNLIVGLPANAAADMHIDNAEGEIVSDFEVEVQASKPVLSRENRRKGVEIRVEQVIVAKINGGGAIFKLKTLNGDVHITKN